MIGVETWAPAYVRLSPEQVRAKTKALCEFADTYRTDHDPEAARKLSLGAVLLNTGTWMRPPC